MTSARLLTSTSEYAAARLTLDLLAPSTTPALPHAE
eukprot:CAMPEP_0179854842 /NCGR_PEP_ID=MMETSP0982-20121206/10181_1 /TAXON_ID=483367 /ORGANISM="non described non described, Strain CCMP 2436" /LENGTH=35 /DNA_ID= /DNA_START= /DNA_END= /DNA_ORIENTATION=